jgi:hypothetical protein
MADRGYSENFRAPNCTLGFDKYLFTAEERVRDNGQKYEQFGCTLIWEESTPKTVFEKAIVDACVSANWGDAAKVVDLIKKGMIKSPFLKGDGAEAHNKKTGELHPGMGAGKWFLRVGTQIAPPVRYKDPNIQVDRSVVYGGCEVFPVLNAYTWINDKGGKGVSFGLQYLQKVADGTPHYSGAGGGVDATKYHETIADEGGAPSSTTGGQGASGLFG